jgi:hypothetical protein
MSMAMNTITENIYTRRVLIEKNEKFYVYVKYSDPQFPILVRTPTKEELQEAKIIYKAAYDNYHTDIRERLEISDNPNEYYTIVDERIKDHYLANLIMVSICKKVKSSE